METQVRAASRKWFARAMMYLDLRKRFSQGTADQYRYKFRHQEKFAFALGIVRAAQAVSR